MLVLWSQLLNVSVDGPLLAATKAGEKPATAAAAAAGRGSYTTRKAGRHDRWQHPTRSGAAYCPHAGGLLLPYSHMHASFRHNDKQTF